MSSNDPGQNPYGQDPYGQNPYDPSTAPPAYQQPYQQPWGYPPYQPYQAAPPTDGLGVGAMVVGIVSLVLMCAYGVGLLGSPAALIMGRISMKRIDRSGGQLGGRGMALAGFVLGIVGTALLVLAVIAVVLLVVFAANGGFDDSTTYSNY